MLTREIEGLWFGFWNGGETVKEGKVRLWFWEMMVGMGDQLGIVDLWSVEKGRWVGQEQESGGWGRRKFRFKVCCGSLMTSLKFFSKMSSPFVCCRYLFIDKIGVYNTDKRGGRFLERIEGEPYEK